eukprot:9503933-Pyramimonas_sp.AAC.3
MASDVGDQIARAGAGDSIMLEHPSLQIFMTMFSTFNVRTFMGAFDLHIPKPTIIMTTFPER